MSFLIENISFIYPYFGVPDLLNISLVCREFYQFILNLPEEIWMNHIIQTHAGRGILDNSFYDCYPEKDLQELCLKNGQNQLQYKPPDVTFREWVSCIPYLENNGKIGIRFFLRGRFEILQKVIQNACRTQNLSISQMAEHIKDKCLIRYDNENTFSLVKWILTCPEVEKLKEIFRTYSGVVIDMLDDAEIFFELIQEISKYFPKDVSLQSSADLKNLQEEFFQKFPNLNSGIPDEDLFQSKHSIPTPEEYAVSKFPNVISPELDFSERMNIIQKFREEDLLSRSQILERLFEHNRWPEIQKLLEDPDWIPTQMCELYASCCFNYEALQTLSQYQIGPTLVTFESIIYDDISPESDSQILQVLDWYREHLDLTQIKLDRESIQDPRIQKWVSQHWD